MSNASSGLCIILFIYAGHLSCILGCNYMAVQHIRIVCIQTFANCLITEIGKQGIDYGEMQRRSDTLTDVHGTPYHVW